MKIGDVDFMERAGLGVLVAVVILLTFGFGYIFGQGHGYSSEVVRAETYKSVACSYAKDAGRATPQWCPQERE